MKYYYNEENYSDGYEIENEILEIVRNQQHHYLEKLDNVSWPLFYHLSPLRHNILNWYPFKEQCSILEVGSGCGALTGLLCEKANYVASVELTQKRATINFERHKSKDNLEIFVGNIKNMQFNRKFDYVIVNGVLEYAGGFIDGDKPYERFLTQLTPFLADDGELLLAIENRLGMKYFSGAKEDHVGELFVGLDGYPHNSKVRTFSKTELSSLLDACDLVVEKFYYPYPDYKFPEVIYSEQGFDKVPISYDVHSYDTDRFMFFDEIEMQNALIRENIGGNFANSFLIVAHKNDFLPITKDQDIQYVKINANRDNAYKICTVVYSDGGDLKVKKQALTKEAVSHLERMNSNYQLSRTSNSKIDLLPIKLNGKELLYDYINLPTVEKILLEKSRNKDEDGFLAILSEFFNVLASYGLQRNYYTGEFHEIFGPIKCNEDLEFTSYSNIDTLFDNIFYDYHKMVVFDYEWYMGCHLPVKFIFWRAVKEFYHRHKTVNNHVLEDRIHHLFGITDEMVGVFYQWEGYFSANYVKMFDKSIIQKKTNYLTNVQDVFDDDYCVANLYIDTGNGFNDHEKIQIGYMKSSELITLEFDLTNSSIRNLRFDPIEGEYCICRIDHAEIDGEECVFSAYNSFSFSSDEDVFLTEDPIYLIQGNYKLCNVLKITFSMETLDKEKLVTYLTAAIEYETAEKDAIKSESLMISQKNEELVNIKVKYENKIKELEMSQRDLMSDLDNLTLDLKNLQSDYEILTSDSKNLQSNYENLAIELNKSQCEISTLTEERKELLHQMEILAQEYSGLINSKTWRFTKPIRIVLDFSKIKNSKS